MYDKFIKITCASFMYSISKVKHDTTIYISEHI